jgi:hypothetical protein
MDVKGWNWLDWSRKAACERWLTIFLSPHADAAHQTDIEFRK